MSYDPSTFMAFFITGAVAVVFSFIILVVNAALRAAKEWWNG